MYINAFSRETDQEKILAFIRQYNFGTLINSVDHIPHATHVPFQIQEDNGTVLTLRTHIARANPQWKSFTPEGTVLVIFQGPNSYISPRWYNHINVPTMNYMAVHLYGSCRILDNPEAVYELLKSQVEQFEQEHIKDYNITSLPENLLQANMRALVCLEIQVQRIEANFKLSQNRDEESYQNVITQLEQQADEDSTIIAGEMKKRRQP